LDSPLTQVGIQQIESLAEHLVNHSMNNPIDHIVTSPLSRATHSATILQNRIVKPLTTLDSLKERSFGIWQGNLFDEIKDEPNFSDVFFQVNDTPIQQGESAIEARKRMALGLRQLNREFPNRKLLVVTHGELLRCFLSGLENGIDGSAYQLFENGSVFEVWYSSEKDQFKYAIF